MDLIQESHQAIQLIDPMMNSWIVYPCCGHQSINTNCNASADGTKMIHTYHVKCGLTMARICL